MIIQFAYFKVVMTIQRRPADLPDFDRPPLNEVVLSVQFGALPFRNHHAGLLWQRFAADYPTVEEYPPIDPVFETFGALQIQQPRLQLLAMNAEPLRYWFVAANGNELLQVQRDRLIHNWRQRNADDEYPRYEALRDKFSGELRVAGDFFEVQGWGQLLCNQCEVSYINVISLPNDKDPTEELASIFTIFAEKYSGPAPGKIERGQFKISYVMFDESGTEPIGRLYVDAHPAVHRPDDKPVIRVTLTARGKPAGETIHSALSWLDHGREVVVRTFASLTTKKMHRLWARRDQ